MVTDPPPPTTILGRDLKISDQNNWGGGGDLRKELDLGGAKLKRGPNILGRGGYEPQ